MLGTKQPESQPEAVEVDEFSQWLVEPSSWNRLWNDFHIYPVQPCAAPALQDWIFHQYFELLRVMGHGFDPDSMPWVPVGACGATLIIGHSSPTNSTPFPDYVAQKVLLSVGTYKEFMEEAQRFAEQAYVEGTHHRDPLNDSLECYEGKDVFRAINEHIPLPEHLRLEIENLSKVDLLLEDLPDGLSECYYRVYETRPIIDLTSVSIDPETVAVIPENVLNKHDAIPFYREDQKIFIATGTYPNNALIDRLGSIGKTRNLEPVVVYAAIGAIRQARELVKSERTAAAIGSPKKTRQKRLGRSRNLGFSINEARIERLNPRSNNITPEDLTEWVFAKAVGMKASDIHCEQVTGQGRVRLRIDGMAMEILRPPLPLMKQVINVIKGKANMGQDQQICDDGGLTISVNDQEYGVRVSAIPFRNSHLTSFQSVVMRLQAKTADVNRLSNLGFEPWADKIIRKAIARPSGINLVTGPTGSGKTTTLYAALIEINRDDTKIVTVEDPIEREIDGLSQTQVNKDRNVTFQAAMRSFLRQDPDVILVGEIRDRETANLAIEASLTGHLVFSTLHTNSATETLARLLELGIERSLLASALTLLQSQRLIRRLCPLCRVRVPIEEAEEAKKAFRSNKVKLPKNIYVPGVPSKGLNACKCNNGYKGRRSIMELVPVDRDIKNAILDGKSTMDIREMCDAKGFPTLVQDGLEKVARGDTTVEEVIQFSDSWE